MGFDEATPIQEQAIPVILEGRDLIGSAQTGTGKTGAFLIPIINRIISTENTNKIKALIIVPTRELAMQIDRQMEGLSYFAPVKSTAVYGGRDGTSFSNEKQYIQDGVEVLICTPGKFLVHLNLGYVDLSDLEFLVLD
ncbi:MAG TPA: ATP-dependent RNA helicase, partial [Bacteroidales bacterium]|nr:ATP-dependent RNA helicase [Bacteroidales bacterium]